MRLFYIYKPSLRVFNNSALTNDNERKPQSPLDIMNFTHTEK